MLRKHSLALVPAIVLAGTFSAYAQAPAPAPAAGQGQKPAPAPMEIKQVKPGLYMVTGMGGNSTVRVGNQGIILVDTKNLGDQFYNDLVAKIKSVSDQPVKHVFVTHVHQDHSGNIGKFTAGGVEVIAHEGLKKNLETGGPKGTGYESAAGKPAPPSTTYSRDKKISLGNIRAEAYNFGPGHTGGDTFVLFPDLRVIALGDHFVAAQPNADYPMGGSILNWSKSLTEILKLDFDTAIPGHGNDPLTKADVQAFQKKIDLIGRKGIELRKKGVAKENIRAEIQTALAADLGNWMITGVVNDMRLDAFYNDLTAAAK
jgi:cyclase